MIPLVAFLRDRDVFPELRDVPEVRDDFPKVWGLEPTQTNVAQS